MELLHSITLIGVVSFLTLAIGILVKLIGFPDQVRINYKHKSTDGLSTSFMIISWLAYALWTFYGILKGDRVIIIGQGLGVLTAGIILWQIFIYRRNKASIVREEDRDKSKNEMKKGKDYIGVGGGCLILNDKNEVLLIRRAGEVRNEAGYWSKPGGGVKFGETAEETMKREMKEELDIDIEITGYLPHTDHIIKKRERRKGFASKRTEAIAKGRERQNLEERGEYQHWVALNFIAKIISGQPQNMEPHKCDKIGWFAMDKLPEKITQTTSEPIANYLAGRYIKLI